MATLEKYRADFCKYTIALYTSLRLVSGLLYSYRTQIWIQPKTDFLQKSCRTADAMDHRKNSHIYSVKTTKCYHALYLMKDNSYLVESPFDVILTIKGSTKNIFFLRKLLRMKERLVDTTINFILKHFSIESLIIYMEKNNSILK